MSKAWDTNPTTAIVLGVNGQDGSYLTELLIRRGYFVVGVGRQNQSLYSYPVDSFKYVQLDLTVQNALHKVLVNFNPKILFHFAAIHGSAGFSYETLFPLMMQVNTGSLHLILEYARNQNPALRIIYANSLKIFPKPYEGEIDETSPYRASCLYSISKITSLELISYYRRHHKVIASNLILFNHESPRHGASYFFPTIARAVAAAAQDPRAKVNIQTLDFWIDWSAADELMDLAIEIAERAPDKDYIFASGRTWYARQAVDELFKREGLDYKNHVVELLPRSDPGLPFFASTKRLIEAIDRRPSKTIFDIVDNMRSGMT